MFMDHGQEIQEDFYNSESHVEDAAIVGHIENEDAASQGMSSHGRGSKIGSKMKRIKKKYT